MVACPDCGTENLSGADLCVQCWRGMTDELARKIPVAAFAVAAADPAAPLAPHPAAPPAPLREVPPPPAPYFTPPPKLVPPPELAPPPLEEEPERVLEPAHPEVPYFAKSPVRPEELQANPAPAAVTQPGRQVFSWGYWHLAVVWAAAWGLPLIATQDVASRFAGRGVLDSILAVQVAAYLVAAVVVTLLVKTVQRGEWRSIGIHWSEMAYEDVFRGMGFGLLMIGALAIGSRLIFGWSEIDPMVRTMVGGTSGPGFVLAALVIVVGAPVIEEVYFRGMLYERLARWGSGSALVGSSLLFVRAHGSFLIPALLVMAFALGWKRRTKSIWYTMGAHSAWNLVVLCIGVFVLAGPAHTFSPPDDFYSLRHPPKWDRLEEVEQASGPGGMSLDLVLTTPAGSFMGVGRADVPPGTNPRQLGPILGRLQSALPMVPGVSSTSGIRETDLVRAGLAKAYELRATMTDPVAGEVETRMVVVVPDQSTKMMMLITACPSAECAEANTEFDAMLRSVAFTPERVQ